MPHYTRAVAISRKDGSKHKLCSISTTPYVAFDNDNAVDVGRNIIWCDLAVDSDNVKYAALCAHEQDAKAILVIYRNRTDYLIKELPYAVGAGFIAIKALSHGCEIYIQGRNNEAPGTDLTYVRVYDNFLNLIRTHIVPYQSTGFHQIREVDGYPIMNDVGSLKKEVNGILFHNTYFIRDYMLGQIDPNNDNIGSVGLVLPGGKLVQAKTTDLWNGYTNQLSRMVVDDYGIVWAAIPGYNTPEPDEIVWVDIVIKPKEPEKPIETKPEPEKPVENIPPVIPKEEPKVEPIPSVVNQPSIYERIRRLKLRDILRIIFGGR